MANPLYFIEGLAACSREQAAAHGLAGVLPTIESRQTSRGPSGSGGVIVGVTSERLGFDQSAQTWRRMPGSKVWFGWWTDAPPGPEDLRRPEQLPGRLVKLMDGREWLVPMARAWSDSGYSHKIPAAVDFNEDGKLIRGKVEPKYRGLEQAAAGYADLYFEGGVIDGEVVLGWACDAISVNYRIGKFETFSLELLDDQLIYAESALKTVIDYQGFLAIVEKKAEGQQSDERLILLGATA